MSLHDAWPDIQHALLTLHTPDSQLKRLSWMAVKCRAPHLKRPGSGNREVRETDRVRFRASTKAT